MKLHPLKNLVLIASLFSGAMANDDLYIGFQATPPSSGVSIRKDLSNTVSIQGIFDILGDQRSYSGRGIYKFQDNLFWDIYGFGEAGIWNWDRGYQRPKDENAFGYGLGIGAEYDLRGLDSNFIPLFISLELDYYSIDFDEDYYYNNNETLDLGLGIHYKF